MARSERSSAQLKAAFERVAKSCGICDADLRTLRSHPKVLDKVRPLAGTSPEYQRHVVERLLAGEQNPFKMIAATLLIYDTVKFGEVTSRLHRALGWIRKEEQFLNGRIRAKEKPNRLADRQLTLDLIVEKADSLFESLVQVSVITGCSPHGTNAIKPDRDDVPTEQNLYAAKGLGLLAKNVRNVPVLQEAHRPVDEEKGLAMRLTIEIRDVADRANRATRRRFQVADEGHRVRGQAKPTVRIITHTKPDGDAIVGVWLAERYLFAGKSVEILFVERGRVLGAYSAGDCLVDVGNTHDPENLFFDHKPPAFPSRYDSCAAKLIWEHIRRKRRPVGHLKDLILAVYAVDAATKRAEYRKQYDESQKNGFHAELKRIKALNPSDADVYRAARSWLDGKYCSDQ